VLEHRFDEQAILIEHVVRGPDVACVQGRAHVRVHESKHETDELAVSCAKRGFAHVAGVDRDQVVDVSHRRERLVVNPEVLPHHFPLDPRAALLQVAE